MLFGKGIHIRAFVFYVQVSLSKTVSECSAMNFTIYAKNRINGVWIILFFYSLMRAYVESLKSKEAFVLFKLLIKFLMSSGFRRGGGCFNSVSRRRCRLFLMK